MKAGRIEGAFNDRYQIYGRVVPAIPAPTVELGDTKQLPWWKVLMLAAASKSGDEGTIRLAMQLADCLPCPTCDFVASACRCHKP